MNIEYKFENLLNDLRTGREIEFVYNNSQYSITNNSKGYWYIYCDTEKQQSDKLCKFTNKEMLLEKISSFEIGGILIKNIFDNLEYDINTLYIL